jgi:hypothetical protein
LRAMTSSSKRSSIWLVFWPAMPRLVMFRLAGAGRSAGSQWNVMESPSKTTRGRVSPEAIKTALARA